MNDRQPDWLGSGVILPRVLAFFGCLIFAAAALGSGLDRQAKVSAHWAPRVPHIFAVQALEVLGEARLNSGDAAGAVKMAAQMIGRAPVDPTSTALMGAGYYAMGKADEADRVFRVAGQMGWRVPLTQAYWMTRALAVDDFSIAGERLDAILRQQPQLLHERKLLDPVERDPRGRAVMVDRLVNRPVWLKYYSSDVEKVPDDVMLLRADVMEGLGQRGTKIGCDGISPAIRKLVGGNALQEAANLWHLHCPEATVNGLADGSFKHADLESVLTPFDWSFIGSSYIDLRLEGEKNSVKTLMISSTARLPQPIAAQLLIIASGKYRISWRSPDQSSQTAKLGVSLGCSRDVQQWSIPRFDPQTRLWQAEIQADSNCIGHWLSLMVVPNGEIKSDTPPAQLSLSDVTLTAY